MADASLAAPVRGRILGSPDAVRGPEDLRGLHYPFGRWVPAEGSLFEVVPGVHWLRMPLPMGGLDHINLWALEDGDSWVLVDCGLNNAVTQGLWEAIFTLLGGRPVRRLIVTHFHPDHIGLAGWLAARWGVRLEMARTEYLMARMLIGDAQPEPPAEVVDFYARAGWPAAALDALRARSWGRYARMVGALPGGILRLAEGDRLEIGGRRWEIFVGRGHSPEHLCLVADGVMISGDQVLPRITSNVSVHPNEPLANPLADWLDSIERLRGVDPGIVVLPAHNEPFTGLHVRLDQLAADHADKLTKLQDFCAVPRTAFESFEILFSRAIGEGDRGIATGEALAHLHWLEARGLVRRVRGDVDRFVSA